MKKSDYEALKEVFEEPDRFEEFARDVIEGAGLDAGEIQIVGLDATDRQIRELIQLPASEPAILFCFDAHLFPGTQKLLEAAQERFNNLAVVLLRDPYDIEFIKRGSACVQAFGFRACQIRAAVETLIKRAYYSASL